MASRHRPATFAEGLRLATLLLDDVDDRRGFTSKDIQIDLRAMADHLDKVNDPAINAAWNALPPELG